MADYIVFAGIDNFNLDPIRAFEDRSDAIVYAKNFNISSKRITEVVYMPENDESINEVIVRFE